MKLIVFIALVAAGSADVSHLVSDEHSAPIVRSNYDISPEGSFQYEYETGNHIVAQAQGVVKNSNSDNPALEVQGAYSYTSPDGTPVQLSYVANEDGYQPQGSHLPVAPPVPAAIQRSLDYIAAHPPPVEHPQHIAALVG
ncbi:hypothetical protein ACJJTC_001729 [Scirpophaga incertulas]